MAKKLDLETLQKEQKIWAAKNFGQQPPYRPLLGVMEELGELAHAHLKEVQGIRGTAAEHRAEAKDAIGDILVYLADYCNRRGFKLQEIIEETWGQVKERDWVVNKEDGDVTVQAPPPEESVRFSGMRECSECGGVVSIAQMAGDRCKACAEPEGMTRFNPFDEVTKIKAQARHLKQTGKKKDVA
jgi:NTP pyrophosphatase (non-canonical NTP hydrolase)